MILHYNPEEVGRILVRRGPTSAKNARLGDTVRVGFVPVVPDL